MTLATERLIVLFDTLLVCLGLTMTVAAAGPLLESATIWIRRPRAGRCAREEAPAESAR